MRPAILLGAAAMVALAALAADQAVVDHGQADHGQVDHGQVDRGQKEAGLACTPCHSLRLVESQRLSRAAWNKELDKMAGWGTKITDREALLEYLVANYGDDKPPSPPAMSKDGMPPRKQQ